jgi:hypothetical protein
MLSIKYPEYQLCRVLHMLSVIMLNVIIQSVVTLQQLMAALVYKR